MSRSSIYDLLHERKAAEDAAEAKEEVETVEQEEEVELPPSRFQSNELSFVRPDGMQDATWHVLADNPLKPGFTIVMGRTPVGENDDLETLAQQVQDQLSASAEPEFTQHLHVISVGGRDARRMKFSRRQQGSLVHQDQVLLLARDENDTPLLVQFIATGNTPSGMTVAERSRFEDMLATVEFRGEVAKGDDEQPAEEEGTDA